MKKKILAILLSVGVIGGAFVGCGEKKEQPKEPQKQEQSKQEDNKVTEKNDSSQEEINQKIKEDAVKGDFVKINDGKMNNKAVYLKGTVSNIIGDSVMPTFTLKTKESDEGYGMYEIKLIDKNLLKGLEDGSKITVYGKVLEKNESGMPSISGNIIELNK